MKIHPELRKCIFQTRLNRFADIVKVSRTPEMGHVPDSGRLRELLKPGNRVFLSTSANLERKTRYDSPMVDLGRILVASDARVPGTLVHEAFSMG